MTSNTQKPIKLSIVFSFRNEQEVLPELIRRSRLVLQTEQNKGTIASYELIFVNDASSDNSLDILKEHSKQNNDIRIITMSRCFGVSPCVLAGMEFASGDAVVYMDADLQDPPEIIPKLLDAWRNSPAEIDVVHTVRESRKGESKDKLFITRLGYIILNKLSSISLPIEAGDFKLLSRRAVNHLLRMREKNPYLRGLVCWIGFKSAMVPYHREARYAGGSKFTIYSASVLNNFFGSAMISFSAAPLKVATLIGLAAILIDFLVMGHALIQKIIGNAIPGWTALMITVLFFGGTQLFCLGIMGLYINAMHEQSKDRPNYIIESTHGFSNENTRNRDHIKRGDWDESRGVDSSTK